LTCNRQDNVIRREYNHRADRTSATAKTERAVRNPFLPDQQAYQDRQEGIPDDAKMTVGFHHSPKEHPRPQKPKYSG
jgi:hypothetical protein